MQRMLAEVTGHMEQQYSAHKYLEKLRVENQTIALTEKDRKVSITLVIVFTIFLPWL